MPSLLEFRRVLDRKSTRLNSSHGSISYAVFCLKKKIPKGFVEEVTVLVQVNVGVDNHGSTRSLTHPSMNREGCIYQRFFFFNDTGTPEIYPLSLRDALPI